MIALSPAAADAIRHLLVEDSGEASGLRIAVDTGGCSGLRYILSLDAGLDDADKVYDADGVRVFVDAESSAILQGLRIDFVKSVGGDGFVFDNPNAGDVCSCGKSFSA